MNCFKRREASLEQLETSLSCAGVSDEKTRFVELMMSDHGLRWPYLCIIECDRSGLTVV